MRFRATKVFIIAVLFGAEGALADEMVDEIKWLREKVQKLEEKVRALENAGKPIQPTNDSPALGELEKKVTALEQGRELDAETARAREKTAMLVSLGADGFTLSSANKSFAIQLKGILQVDSRTFFS